MIVGFANFFNLFNPFWWFSRIFSGVKDEEEELDEYYDGLTEEEQEHLEEIGEEENSHVHWEHD